MAAKKINVTKDYEMFLRSEGNRDVNLAKHGKLRESLVEYGFIPSHPISCFRDDSGELVVKDGQHRLALAAELNLPVYWVEDDIDYDVAKVSSAGKAWNVRDHAEKFAKGGSWDYREGLKFAEEHRIGVGVAFAILAGNTSFSNIDIPFYRGEFKVRDREYAQRAASLYAPLVKLQPKLRNVRFIEACMAVCRVAKFDGDRLVKIAGRCHEKLKAYSTRDGYLGMLEDIYNHGRQQVVGLKAEAVNVMKARGKRNG